MLYSNNKENIIIITYLITTKKLLKGEYIMNVESYDALTVARYIINQCNKTQIDVSNLKLQKLLYYVQATFLVINKKECFKEQIEAWDFGPVVPIVYNEFKKYGSNNIPRIETYIDLDFDSPTFFKKINYDENIINENDKNYINQVIEHFGKFSAFELVEKTHNEDPWKNTYTSKLKHIIIENKDIAKYFEQKISLVDNNQL